MPPGDDDVPAPTTDYGFLVETLRERDAVAVVHVADGADPDQRYLTRLAGPDRPYAFALVRGGDGAGDSDPALGGAARTTLLAPPSYDREARRRFPGDEVVARDGADAHPAERVAALVRERAGPADGDDPATVLVPRQIRHDAAVHLQRAGLAVASTDAVRRARARKSDAERAAVRRAQAAAVAGIDRAAAVLAGATVGADGDAPLSRDGAPLSTGRLRRAVDAAVVRAGADPAGDTVVAAGEACADPRARGDRPVRAGETVLVDASPRGPAGYRGDCARTFVLDGEGGWERRAHVAVTAARRAGLDAVEPGVPARRVRDAVAAELSAYGFAAAGDDRAARAAGHGVGLALHEAPSLRSTTTLERGATVAIEAGVRDPDVGGVRVEDVVVVGEGPAVEYPVGMTPEPVADAAGRRS